MRILVIDNNIDRDSWGSADLRRLAHLASGATVYVRRAPQGDLPNDPSQFDRIIVSGSKTSALEDAPWISKLHSFILKSIEMKKPYLGVCFGHQALVRAIAGKQSVRVAAEPEFGWSKVELLTDSHLLSGLPREFYTFSSHFEEVSSLPREMKRLARSEACEIQACQLENSPIFGIQFHPEKTAEGARKSLNFRMKEQKRTGKPKQLLHPDKSDSLYDPKIGETIFRNFLSL